MTRSLAVLAGVALWPALAPAQQSQCIPDQQSFGWQAPPNVAISDDNAVRWPTDATLRVAYGGTWCPSPDQIEITDLETGEGVAAQVRLMTPVLIVENDAAPLTIMEIDPMEALGQHSDYRVTIRPPDPFLPSFAEYIFEFRTRNTAQEPLPDFEGVVAVETAGHRCDGEAGPFGGTDANNPSCVIPSRLRLRVQFQPANRPEMVYNVYRTRSTLLDREGNELPDSPFSRNTPELVDVQPGGRDLGTGIPARRAPVTVHYFPLPRRDCFSVRLVDEWGRERGDLENEACVDLNMDSKYIRDYADQEPAVQAQIDELIGQGTLPMDPCPDGCEGQQCQFGFDPPNPFESGEPLPGQDCENIGLNGGDPDRPIPPPPVDGADAAVPDLPDAGGDPPDGTVSPDATPGQDGEGGGGSGGDCAGMPGVGFAGWPALLILLLPAFIARRQRGR